MTKAALRRFYSKATTDQLIGALVYICHNMTAAYMRHAIIIEEILDERGA